MIRVWGAILVVAFLFPGTAPALAHVGDHFIRLGTSYVQNGCQR